MKTKENNAITLIALVVTIILLLILAGTSISMLTGQNGILNRAREAKEQTENASKEEQRELAKLKATTNLGVTEYKGTLLPEGFAPIEMSENKNDDGLVIIDKNGNEYVRIEVPKTTEVYSTAGMNITDFTDEECIKIENDLHNYTEFYRNGTNCSDTYAEDSEEGWFKSAEEYNAEKQKMLKSVYQNDGFWIGRYEAGITEFRTAEGEATEIPVSKENMYPYTFVTRTQAQALAKKVYSGSYTSSLMFGVQWDLVLKYIEEKTVEQADNANKENVRNEIKEKLNSDSTSIGNFSNSKFFLNKGKYTVDDKHQLSETWNSYTTDAIGFVENKQKKERKASWGILTTTGCIEVQNIFDLAGNVWEWSIEKSANGDMKCISRGSGCGNEGSDYCISYRNYRDNVNNSWGFGFRVTLY